MCWYYSQHQAAQGNSDLVAPPYKNFKCASGKKYSSIIDDGVMENLRHKFTTVDMVIDFDVALPLFMDAWWAQAVDNIVGACWQCGVCPPAPSGMMHAHLRHLSFAGPLD